MRPRAHELAGSCKGGMCPSTVTFNLIHKTRFIPDLILYLSCPFASSLRLKVLNLDADFYTKHELPFRLALFWMSSNVCSIIASFIAFGVLHMRGVLGRAGWR